MNKNSVAEAAVNADATISPVDLPDSTGRWIKRMIYGALVGVGAILPGVSGGAFCAAFGIYRPLMDFVAHPGRKFKKNIMFFLPFLIGCALGFVLLAGLVGWLLKIDVIRPIVIAFFIGCIAGTMPSLYQEANGRQWKPLHYIILLVSTLLAGWGLVSMDKVSDMQALIADPRSLSYVITWVVCGAIFVLGFIMPGMSPSSIIMYAGLYEPMTDGIGSMNMSILLPFLLGCALCVILLSKLVSMLFNKAGRTMFAIIIGVVIASSALVAYDEVVRMINSDSYVSPACIASAGAVVASPAFAEYKELISPVESGSFVITCIGSIAAVIVGTVVVLLLAKLDPRQDEGAPEAVAASAALSEPVETVTGTAETAAEVVEEAAEAAQATAEAVIGETVEQ
ncbi:MAG: DUF368 domain-containing protein [Ruminococcaceae bacterium]|nr:DUF368 domain-containing protein [Oscillospiraceae bacterium]